MAFPSYQNVTVQANNTATLTLTPSVPGYGARLVLTTLIIELTGATTEVSFRVGGSVISSIFLNTANGFRVHLTGECIFAGGDNQIIDVMVAADGTRTVTKCLAVYKSMAS